MYYLFNTNGTCLGTFTTREEGLIALEEYQGKDWEEIFLTPQENPWELEDIMDVLENE